MTRLLLVSFACILGGCATAGSTSYSALSITPEMVKKEVKVGRNVLVGVSGTSENPGFRELYFKVAYKDEDGFGAEGGEKILYSKVTRLSIKNTRLEGAIDNVVSVITFPFLLIGTALGLVHWQ